MVAVNCVLQKPMTTERLATVLFDALKKAARRPRELHLDFED